MVPTALALNFLAFLAWEDWSFLMSEFIDMVVNLLVLRFSHSFSVFVVGVTVSSSIESRGDGDSVWRDWQVRLGS